jgi:Bacterial type II and III secretion system protein
MEMTDMKRIVPFTIFFGTAIFGFSARGGDGVPPEYQPRPANSPQRAGDERSSSYAPTGYASPRSVQPDQPVPTAGTSSDGQADRELSLKAAVETVSKVKAELSRGKLASPSEQAECLRLAAVLAELGGLDKDAKHLRDEAEKDRPPLSVMEVLTRRQAQLDALQAQVAALRRMTRTEQQVLVEVKMIEISPSEMTALLGSREKVPEAIISNRDLFTKLQELREKGLAKVLAEPTLITVSGRPAYFHSGGELPFVRNQTVEFKSYGTQLDLLPQSLGNDKVRLDVKAGVSFVDPTYSVTTGGVTTPGLNVRECATAVECRFGQTVMIAGLVQESKLPATAKRTDDNATVKSATGEAPQESQLLVLLKATIVKDSEVAHAAAASHGSGHYGPGSSLDSTPATKTK